MKTKLVLLVFLTLTSILLWNNIDVLINEDYPQEQSIAEDQEYETPFSEEVVEALEEENLYTYSNYFPASFNDLDQIFAFYYKSNLQTVFIEPEVNPPRC